MTSDVSDYIASAAVDHRQIMKTLHQLILRLYPDARVDMQYKMPTYHFGEGWVAMASQKRHVSLYTCGAPHIAEFKRRHPKIKTGKGCINLKPTDPLPLADLENVVTHAIEHPKG